MDHKVILSRLAEDDLENIIRFISDDNPEAALRVAADVIKHLRVLEKFPRLGRVVPEFGEEALREIIHSPYRLIYEVNDQAARIEVIRIWHGARGKPESVPSAE